MRLESDAALAKHRGNLLFKVAAAPPTPWLEHNACVRQLSGRRRYAPDRFPDTVMIDARRNATIMKLHPWPYSWPPTGGLLFLSVRRTLSFPYEQVSSVGVKGKLFGARLTVSPTRGNGVISGTAPGHAAEIADLVRSRIPGEAAA